MSFTEIPILDVSAARGTDPAARAKLAQDFFAAYGSVGFGYISGHGIAQDVIDGVFQASARFHALPRDQKLALRLNHLHRGFIPINSSTDVNSTLAAVTKPNQSESFMVMREAGPNDPDVVAGAYLAGPNQWPELDGFRAAVMAYNDALAELARQMMEIAALAIDVAPGRILPAFDWPTTWLRLLYYPTAQPMAPSDLYGSAPHTDFGCLTLLAQDDVGGLQVMTPEGDWVDAPPVPGTFVLNVGDMLHRWSNGRLRSTPHRVINRSGRARYSCPFFYDPNVETVVAPLTGTPAFEPVHFGDFLRSELGASYDTHKAVTDATT